MGRKQIAAMGMVGVLLGAGSLLASTGSASATVAPTSPKRCLTAKDDRWPAWTNGRPAGNDPKTAEGVYMWHNGTGWHVRVTHRHDALHTFAGRITTTGRFFGVRAVRSEGHDALTVSADHHAITFRFYNFGAIDGLNFRTRCAPSIDFGFTADGTVLPAGKVTIGHNAMNPATDPFSIAR